jgi:hypothetical protein
LVVGSGIVLGVALTQWPYAAACGFPLFGYLATILVVLVMAGWGFIASWRHRMAVAHIAALVMGFWGVLLAAEQILPRIGYAANEATWMCHDAEPSPAPPVPAAPPAASPSNTPTADAAAPSQADSAPEIGGDSVR